MRKQLTQKQLNFTCEYIKNDGNGVQAALATYNTKNYKSASKIADTNLNNPNIQKVIEKSLSDKGITVDKISSIFAEGLNARIVGNSAGILKYNASKIPDHNTRHKYLELLMDVLGIR